MPIAVHRRCQFFLPRSLKYKFHLGSPESLLANKRGATRSAANKTMRPAGARASNPPTVQTGLWADLGPRSATPPPKTTPRRKPETLAEENARLRARVAELEAVASMAGPARRCEAAQLDVSSAAEPIRQRLEQQRTTILRLEALVERQAKALDATDADGAATEELLDRLARALRGVAVPYVARVVVVAAAEVGERFSKFVAVAPVTDCPGAGVM